MPIVQISMVEGRDRKAITKCVKAVARASGVAWMLGVGRFGGVLGALLGGVLLQAGYTMNNIISSLSAVAILASSALLFNARVRREA